MLSLNEVLDTAKRANFDYTIVFYDETKAIKLAVGLNGLTKKINDTLNSYIQLLNYLGIKYTIEIYDVRTGQQISIMDVPMFFNVDQEIQNSTTRPGGYM